MNNNQLMTTTLKQSKQLSSFPKTKLLKEQILAFQNSLNSPFDQKFTKILVQNKKKVGGIYKTKTIGVFEDKQSLTDSSKDGFINSNHNNNKKKNSNKKNKNKNKNNNYNDNNANSINSHNVPFHNDESTVKDMSICSMSIYTEDKLKDEKESEEGNSKRMSEKHVLNTKYSLKKLMPEQKSNFPCLRDSSVKEKRPLINMFPGKVPMAHGLINNLMLIEKSANNSGWNSNSSNNSNFHMNKFQVVKKEKTLTLLKIKENKFIKEARERDREREKEKEKAKENSTQESKDNDDCFSYEKEKPCELTEDEKAIYGNREMKQYKKQCLLGKGGCGIVWKCLSSQTQKQCAVKQISKKTKEYSSGQVISSHNNFCQIAKNEIEILTLLNKDSKCPYIVDIYNSYEDSNDIWFSFEMGGKSLSSLCFKIKGEFHNNERIYSIKKGNFLVMIMTTEKLKHFKLMIRAIIEAIKFISDHGIVHSDIKPENILIEYTDANEDQGAEFGIKSIKVIDFGSAFYISSSLNSLSSNTPEYMSPEVTEYMELNTMGKERTKIMNDLISNPWSIDMWSLGVTLLEIVLSCPLWMSYKAKVVINGKKIFKTGLFGFKGRDGNKIHQKQIEVSHSLHKLLMQSLITDISERNSFEDLLSKMLNTNPKQRISPIEALSHPFLSTA